jgi:hypothetical protein
MLLRGAKRRSALEVFWSVRTRPMPPQEVMFAGCGEAAALDPLLHEASYFHGRGLAVADPAAGLRQATRALARCPKLLRDMFRSMFAMRKSSSVGRFRSLRERANTLEFGTTPADRLARAFLLLFSVEYDGDLESLQPAIALIGSILEDRPAESVAWLISAVLHLRANRLDRAERDLRIAREGLGDVAPVLFHEALLLMARGKPRAAARAKLLAAKSAGFRVWGDTGWSVALYPRLTPLAGTPGLEFLRK